MASTSLYNESPLPEMLSSATTVPSSFEKEELKWIWFVVPFLTALILFFCFEFVVILLLCRRNRYRKAHLLFTDDDGQLMYSTDRINENVILSGYRGIRSSISLSHGMRGHLASTEYCSMCGNTASRDGFFHDTSTFRGYRDHRRHTRDGLLLYGETPVNHIPLTSTMNHELTASHDGSVYAREPSYNPKQVSRAFIDLSSVSDIYTARSTDAEDDTYTPRFTPTVSRSISEDLADSETEPPSAERNGGEFPTQAQRYNLAYIHYHGNSLDSYSTTSNASEHQLVGEKSTENIRVKRNGQRNFLNTYFVNRGRPAASHSHDGINHVGGDESLSSSVIMETEQLENSTDRKSLVKHSEHPGPLHSQEELEDTRHFIESYLASSCDNVSITAYSYV